MKNKIVLIFLALFSIILVSSLVNAIDVSVENYYPTPVEAGDYFTVWIKVTNYGESPAENSAVRFKQSFPFTLDPGEEEEKIIDKLEQKGAVTKRFKIRVDKEAKEGDNDLTFEYKDCGGCIWKKISMPITVIEFQTMFDVVLQELNAEGVFIAIANIGKNPANAITVSIPEQEFFKTDLTSASIVGNLGSGDYTMVGFKILPKQKTTKEKQELFVQIAYTDPFGVRRTIVEQVLLNPSSLSRVSMDEMQARGGMRQKPSLLKNIWFWAFIILLILALRKKILKKFKKFKG